MSVRFGGRVVEFEKGKSAVAVPSKEKLATVITTLIEAARAGEARQADLGLDAARNNSRVIAAILRLIVLLASETAPLEYSPSGSSDHRPLGQLAVPQ
jgi:hypothetical protein